MCVRSMGAQQGPIRLDTFGHATGRGGNSTRRLAFSLSTHIPFTMLQPPDSRKLPGNQKYEPIWTHLELIWSPPGLRGPMRYALGHRSSPFHRFGAICGVPSAHRTIFIDDCPQLFHQMTSSLSPVSSRDLTIIWGISRVGGAPPPA